MGGCMGKKQEKPAQRLPTWPVPYLSRLEAGANVISPGQSVLVRGYINTKKSTFDISLGTGPRVDGNDRDDILLFISTNVNNGTVTLNSLTNNQWQKEVKLKHTFKVGPTFEYRIRAHEDRYEIFADRHHLVDFPYRQSLSQLSHIYVTGEVELCYVTWEGKYYNVPYEATIQSRNTPNSADNFKLGQRLNVTGQWVANKQTKKPAQRFSINLYAGNDIAFHFQPRFSEKAVIRNSQVDNNWQKEEKKGGFPFDRTRNFDVTLICEEKGFKCIVDGVDFCTFNHRLTTRPIDRILIDGDIDLHAVHLK